MAEDHVSSSPENVTADSAAPPPSPEAIRTPETAPIAANGIPAVEPQQAPVSALENPFRKSMTQLIVGWVCAIAVFAATVFILLMVFTSMFGPGLAVRLGAPIVAFLLFSVLDGNLWLSRLFGLQTGPNSSSLQAVLSWFMPFGIGSSLRDQPSEVDRLAHADEPGAHPSHAKKKPVPNEPKDIFREVAETVVFVVVLVLLLKTFIAEAFVIPTGSMATTLWGYQKDVTCPECGFKFPVNCSSQVDPQNDRRPVDVMGCVCPNCRYVIHFENRNDPPANSGDRVLVAKFLYDSGLQAPRRHDVVVFKFPDDPQKNHVAMNYIKRLIGLQGETIGIHGGKLYVATNIEYPPMDPSVRPEDLRRREHMFMDDLRVRQMLEKDVRRPMDDPSRKFQIIRKAPDVILALARPVFDNDHQARDLVGTQPPRWEAKNWMADNPKLAKRFSLEAGKEQAWLRYRNILRDSTEPELITDIMGYNSGWETAPREQPRSGLNWVGDLTLEFDVAIERAAAGDELWIELCKGVDRFQARFDLATGECKLVRRQGVPTPVETVLDTKPTKLNKPGTYKMRLSNVDERLTLWVGDDLPFGDGVVYDPPKKGGPTAENDLQPASIAAKGAALSVDHLKLYRDTYYTVRAESGHADTSLGAGGWSNPREWHKLNELPFATMYVQPKHYLCLGDNSPESSDGRYWGLVPDRLMLGRALLVYFPFPRVGQIR
ncbi:MAG: S26 family signal peptidase [Gemmataceae bacterium]|nr:S26 family signal peptidase [Gemmataceae bacterium]